MKKVIITGAAGFIGGALTERLLSQGIMVWGIDISADKLKKFEKHSNFTPIVADFSKYEYLDKLIEEREFDCFIHTAWVGSFGGADYYNYELHNQNITPTCVACEKAAVLMVKRFVFCGSSYQYMYTNTASYPVNYYGIVKKATMDYCKAICLKNGIECNIAVLTNTYGYGDVSSKAVNTFIRKLNKNENLNLVPGDKPNDWVYVDDTVSGIIAVATSPCSSKVYYVGHKDITTFKSKLIEMKQVLGSKSELEFGTFQDETFVDYTNLDAKELYNDTGFECEVTFQEGIVKTSEWIKLLEQNK